MSETRFPPLDDMPEHFEKLEYSAKQLDRLSVNYWNRVYDSQLQKSQEQFPYFPMQIVLWGIGNENHMNFKSEADFYKKVLSDYSWVDSTSLDSYRDHAEQCFRIMNSYINVHENIDKLASEN